MLNKQPKQTRMTPATLYGSHRNTGTVTILATVHISTQSVALALPVLSEF